MSASTRMSELRSKAEQKLATVSSAGLDKTVGPARLVHELQVHQVELEMQNEVLSETLAQVEIERAKYQDLFDFAPVGYLMLSTNGAILEVNRAAEKMLGRPAAELRQRQFQQFFVPESLPEVDRFFKLVLKGNGDAVAQFLPLWTRHTMPQYVNAQGHVFLDAAGSPPQVRMVLMDVTALKVARDDVAQVISGFGEMH
jgi:PAS domain S-box-containing protein